ncbi:MAG: vitamin B12-dependent ribonucleotide reductase [Clostridiaceae bacterium]|jgi:ribonucleoside-diphosphate reductase alpha chain|nr:vitamin B12-dependent ribonucleotide reductase [Clostridiaceae bacterium]
MAQLRDLMVRYYTKELEETPDRTVFDLFEWVSRDVLIVDHKSGRTLTDMKGLEFPAHYSQNACDIIASKYFRKAGVGSPEGSESSMRQVADRMVGFWVDALQDEGLVETKEEAAVLYDELVYTFLNQMFAPNSPQWFNTGIKRNYGITGGKSGLYYYDEAAGQVVESKDDYTRTQASACFILSVEDKLLGEHSISDTYVTETKLFRGGSGTGTNFSAIRAEGEKLTGGGASSGLMSFLKGLDRNAGAIKSGGTTRRAAKMVCLDLDHPEIERFIQWKATEEDKVLALAKMGYDADMDGEAYQTVSGQNSNNSIRIPDAFMRMVEQLEVDPDATITLTGRVDSRVDREVRVADLWRIFNQAAWRCADPAPQFTDTFNAWHTCPAGEDGDRTARHNRLNSTNPCGEYAFLDDTSCNLASINILRFLDAETGSFDLQGYLHMIALCQMVLEASVHWGQFPTPDIARKTWLFRTTGLGMANLAALLMSVGLPYDSDEARTLSAALVGILTGHSYYVSSLMAEKSSPFACYDLNRDDFLRVIRNHARVAGALDGAFDALGYDPVEVDHNALVEIGMGDLSGTLIEVWQAAIRSGEAHGFRNAQVSVMAPTGTISFAMDCASTSIEPFFSHVMYKKLSGGGYMKLANPVVEAGLRRLGYEQDEVDDILAYILREEDGRIADGKIEGAPHLLPEHLPVFDTANQCGTGKRYIHYSGHVRMVAALTPLLSGAISKTVNLPREATVEDFMDVHLLAWHLGVKGITLYRDGSKAAQPLNLRLDPEQEDVNLADLSYKQLLAFATSARERLGSGEQNWAGGVRLSRRDKPVGIRSGHTHPAQIDDVKIYTTVNRNAKGQISEIYITTDREGTLIMGLLNSLSKTISVMLQYQIPAQNISKMLRGQKYEPYGFVTRHPYIKYCTSISDLISKIIDIEIGDFSRCQVKPESGGLPDTLDTAPAFPDLPDREYATGVQGEPGTGQPSLPASVQGERLYDGSTCPTCSSTRMVRNGTCKVCLDCGTTTGCS